MSRPLVANAGSAKQVRRAKQTAKQIRERELSELKAVSESTAGLRVLWRVLERCGIHALSFDAENPHRTSFNEGARNIGNYLLAELFAADPDAYTRMQKDHARLDETIPEPDPRPDDDDELTREEDDGD